MGRFSRCILGCLNYIFLLKFNNLYCSIKTQREARRLDPGQNSMHSKGVNALVGKACENEFKISIIYIKINELIQVRKLTCISITSDDNKQDCGKSKSQPKILTIRPGFAIRVPDIYLFLY